MDCVFLTCTNKLEINIKQDKKKMFKLWTQQYYYCSIGTQSIICYSFIWLF